MADSAEFTSEQGMAIALRNKPMAVIQTQLTKAILLACLGLYTSGKTSDIYGMDLPQGGTYIEGAEHNKIRVAESDLEGAYEPLVASIIEHDYKRMALRDTVPVESSYSVKPTYTVAVDANGSITTVTPSGGSGFAGSPPTLIAVPAVGTYGHGAVLIAVMSGGTVNSVTTQFGGVDYTTGAVVQTNAGFSEGEIFARPIFHPSKIKTVGIIYKNDVKTSIRLAASQKKDVDIALMDLTGDAIVGEIAKQVLQIDRDLISGAPTDESARFWDYQYGLLNAIDDGATTAVYAGVDRTDALGSTYWWRGIVDTAAKNWGVDDFVDDANLGKGLKERGIGCNLAVVNPKILLKWKKQAVAQQVNVNNDDKVREMAKFGFRSEVLLYGNTYVIGHPGMPVKTGLALNTDSFLFRFYNGMKFSPTQLWDMEGQSGGKEAHRFFVETNWLWSVIPNMNVKYVNIS